VVCGIVYVVGWQGSPEAEMFFSAKRGRWTTVWLLLKRHPSLASAKDLHGWTPLHWAARMGDEHVVELLLKYKADVNVKGQYGDTPLHDAAACFRGRAVAELLVAKGANVNAANDFGSTPLHDAAYYCNKAVAEVLLANGADVNVADKDGCTPLSVANTNSKDIADLFRQHGGHE
jgi:uncharacterized protein